MGGQHLDTEAEEEEEQGGLRGRARARPPSAPWGNSVPSGWRRLGASGHSHERGARRGEESRDTAVPLLAEDMENRRPSAPEGYSVTTLTCGRGGST